MPGLDVGRAGAGKARRRAGLVVALVLAALVATPSGSFADPLADRQAEADRVQAELAELDAELERAVEAYNAATVKLQETEAKIEENNRRLSITRENLTVAQNELNQALVSAYMHGDTDIVQVVLAADSLSAMLDEVQLVSRATQHSAEVLERVRAYREEIADRQAELERQQQARREAVAEQEARREQVERGLAERQARLAGLNAEIRQIIEERERAEREAAAARARQAQAALARASEAAAQTPAPDIGGAATVDAPASGGGGGGGGDSSGGGGGGGDATVPPPPPSSSVGASAAGIAMSQLGVPYRWAGASPSTGFDCSGLIMWAYAQVGVSLPHNAAAQYAVGTPVDRANLQPGDLVFFNGLGHAGIYIGGGQYVHAPHSGDVVKVSSMNRSDYVGARRVG